MSKDQVEPPTIKLYKIRWFLLALFVLYATASSVQWVQYCIISEIIMRYYNVSALAVDWTSIITMVTYPPLILPGCYVIDKMGLRICMLIGVTGTTIGTWIKVFSIGPHLFWVTFTGQTIVFVSQIFILSIPPKLAAIWFGVNEVSRACSIGAFGTQLGTALGFIFPRLLVKNHENLDDIGSDLSRMFYAVAIYTTIVAILMIVYFKKEPEYPPSIAQVEVRSKQSDFDLKCYLGSYKALLTNKPFLMLMVAYGVNIGVFAGVCTILNQFILAYFPDSEDDSGRLGLLMVVVGMLGSVVFGYILDKTRKFKETTFGIYVMVTLGLAAFLYALETKSMALVYVATLSLGFFQNAYYPVGFETAAEITFPQPESTSSGLLISMAQTFGTIFTLLMDKILQAVGPFWALASMIILLGIGCVITAATPNVLRRQEASKLRGSHKLLNTL